MAAIVSVSRHPGNRRRLEECEWRCLRGCGAPAPSDILAPSTLAGASVLPPKRPTQHDKKGMELARDIAWRSLDEANASSIAGRAGACWHEETHSWRLPYLGITVVVSRDSRQVTAVTELVTPMEEVLILRYLSSCDGTPPASRWISFRELPGGRLYHAPFVGRTARPLAARFDRQPQAFAVAAATCAGEQLEFGDASYRFRVLPHLWIAIVLNCSDEEFPADVNIIFDEAVRQQFTTEDCVAAAQVLCRRLLRAAPRP